MLQGVDVRAYLAEEPAILPAAEKTVIAQSLRPVTRIQRVSVSMRLGDRRGLFSSAILAEESQLVFNLSEAHFV